MPFAIVFTLIDRTNDGADDDDNNDDDDDNNSNLWNYYFNLQCIIHNIVQNDSYRSR